MYVSATTIQNNFGKYLKLCERENVIITKNGKKRALLLYYPRNNDGYEAGEPVYDYGTSPKKRPENRVTYREFLEMTENSEKRYELIDGVVYLMASPGFTHQNVLGRLHIIFHVYFEGNESCSPYLSPFDVDLIRQPLKEEREVTEDDINVVEPDLMVLCDPEKDVNEKDRYKGTPELVVEILSPSTRSKDMVKKLDLYMESGIKEFWILDPKLKAVRVFGFRDYDLKEDAHFGVKERAESFLYPGLSADVGGLLA
jgi:Uma2 family endonuclease